MELIRNIVVLGGSDRETYHTAQQEMGSEPPGQREDESAPDTHPTHTHVATHSFNVSACTQHSNTLTHTPQCSAQDREAIRCVDKHTWAGSHTHTHALPRHQYTPLGHLDKY